MDANAGPSTKILTDVGVNIAGGTGVALLAGLGLWMRKLVGLPKRVKILESTNIVVLENLGAQTKYLLAQNQHRRESDKSPELVHAEDLLRKADERMDDHLRNGLSGGRG